MFRVPADSELLRASGIAGAALAGLGAVISSDDPPTLEEVIEKYGTIRRTTDHTTRTTIDFDLAAEGQATDMSPMERASGGRFGSGLVISAMSGDVVGGTLRLGPIDLPDVADDFLALAEYEEVVKQTDPPLEVNPRFRDAPGEFQVGLDIMHVDIESSAPKPEVASWLDRLIPRVRAEKTRIREKATEIGREMDV
jgi:hypothetical protein